MSSKNNNRALKKLLAPVFLIFFALGLQAQANSESLETTEPEQNDWLSVEGPHLTKNVYESLKLGLQSRQEALQMEVLDSLKERLRNGSSTGSDPNLLRLLYHSSLDSFIRLEEPKSWQSKASISVRLRSLELVHLAGGEEAYKLLKSIISLETDPLILGQAYIYSLDFNAFPDSELQKAMARHLRDPFPSRPHTFLITSLLYVIQENHKRYPGSCSSEMFDSLLFLSNDPTQLSSSREKTHQLIKFILGLS